MTTTTKVFPIEFYTAGPLEGLVRLSNGSLDHSHKYRHELAQWKKNGNSLAPKKTVNKPKKEKSNTKPNAEVAEIQRMRQKAVYDIRKTISSVIDFLREGKILDEKKLKQSIQTLQALNNGFKESLGEAKLPETIKVVNKAVDDLTSSIAALKEVKGRNNQINNAIKELGIALDSSQKGINAVSREELVRIGEAKPREIEVTPPVEIKEETPAQDTKVETVETPEVKEDKTTAAPKASGGGARQRATTSNKNNKGDQQKKDDKNDKPQEGQPADTAATPPTIENPVNEGNA